MQPRYLAGQSYDDPDTQMELEMAAQQAAKTFWDWWTAGCAY
jgi:hypothetical protein